MLQSNVTIKCDKKKLTRSWCEKNWDQNYTWARNSKNISNSMMWDNADFQLAVQMGNDLIKEFLNPACSLLVKSHGHIIEDAAFNAHRRMKQTRSDRVV